MEVSGSTISVDEETITEFSLNQLSDNSAAFNCVAFGDAAFRQDDSNPDNPKLNSGFLVSILNWHTATASFKDQDSSGKLNDFTIKTEKDGFAETSTAKDGTSADTNHCAEPESQLSDQRRLKSAAENKPDQDVTGYESFDESDSGIQLSKIHSSVIHISAIKDFANLPEGIQESFETAVNNHSYPKSTELIRQYTDKTIQLTVFQSKSYYEAWRPQLNKNFTELTAKQSVMEQYAGFRKKLNAASDNDHTLPDSIEAITHCCDLLAQIYRLKEEKGTALNTLAAVIIGNAINSVFQQLNRKMMGNELKQNHDQLMNTIIDNLYRGCLGIENYAFLAKSGDLSKMKSRLKLVTQNQQSDNSDDTELTKKISALNSKIKELEAEYQTHLETKDMYGLVGLEEFYINVLSAQCVLHQQELQKQVKALLVADAESQLDNLLDKFQNPEAGGGVSFICLAVIHSELTPKIKQLCFFKICNRLDRRAGHKLVKYLFDNILLTAPGSIQSAFSEASSEYFNLSDDSPLEQAVSEIFKFLISPLESDVIKMMAEKHYREFAFLLSELNFAQITDSALSKLYQACERALCSAQTDNKKILEDLNIDLNHAWAKPDSDSSAHKKTFRKGQTAGARMQQLITVSLSDKSIGRKKLISYDKTNPILNMLIICQFCYHYQDIAFGNIPRQSGGLTNSLMLFISKKMGHTDISDIAVLSRNGLKTLCWYNKNKGAQWKPITFLIEETGT